MPRLNFAASRAQRAWRYSAKCVAAFGSFCRANGLAPSLRRIFAQADKVGAAWRGAAERIARGACDLRKLLEGVRRRARTNGPAKLAAHPVKCAGRSGGE
jgi:hypothetical protein